MNAAARSVIAQFGLAPLPGEGGFFRRTWTSTVVGPDGRPAGSAIQFLLTPAAFSALHRIDADECWCFHAGDPIEHVQIDSAAPDGARVVRLGTNFPAGDVPQFVVPAGTWQGARLAGGPAGWALVSCVLTPAWDERGFALGERAALSREFPAAAEWIHALTR